MKQINLLYLLVFSLLFTACITPIERATEGTQSSPVIVTVDVVFAGSSGSTDVDTSASYYKFTTLHEGNYTVTTSSISNNANFKTGVYESNGSLSYGYSNDGEPLIVNLEAQSTYSLIIRSGPITTYDLLVTSPPVINSSPAFATKLTLEQNLTTFVSANESSYYLFDVNESANYSIVANNLSSASDLNFELYANEFYDTYVDSASSDSENNESLNIFLETGRYNLKVRHYGDYDITFNLLVKEQI